MKYVIGSITSQLSSQNVSLKQTAHTPITPASPPHSSIFDLLHSLPPFVSTVKAECQLDGSPTWCISKFTCSEPVGNLYSDSYTQVEHDALTRVHICPHQPSVPPEAVALDAELTASAPGLLWCQAKLAAPSRRLLLGAGMPCPDTAELAQSCSTRNRSAQHPPPCQRRRCSQGKSMVFHMHNEACLLTVPAGSDLYLSCIICTKLALVTYGAVSDACCR